MANSNGKKKKTTQVTSAKAWKGKRQTKAYELELPSGNVCLVRPLSIPVLVTEGLIPDNLLGISQGHIDKAEGKPPADFKKKKSKAKADDATAEEIMKDPQKMVEFFKSMDKIVSRAVVEPACVLHFTEDPETGEVTPISDDDRDEEILYTDEVDISDKMFIFNHFVGGSNDLDSFREEFSESLDGIQTGKVQSVPSE